MYPPVPKHPDFVAIEHRMLEFWASARIFRQLREKNANGQPWSFLDGPITANNPMGVHHAWGRTLKDIFQRFHAMHGRHLRYQNGFDCQGLWVEVEVEKERGFASKRDIADYGIDAFVRDCKERVLTFAARQTQQSIRLGYWMDWDDPATLLALRDALKEGRPEITLPTPNGGTMSGTPESLIAQLGKPELGGSYFTFSSENNYTIWSFLKKCHQEGHIYRGTDVMPWCWRCGTGISQMEVAEGRRITTHTSVFVRFPLLGREREALLVWTTTPWTLSSNVAVAVNPEKTYLKIRQGDWIYYVGKENFTHVRVQDLEAGGKRHVARLHSLESILKGAPGGYEILGELPGQALLGLRYEGPFDHLPAQNLAGGLSPFGPASGVTLTAVECHKVIPWKEVSGTEGTGFVHIAPGCGSEDYGLGQENGLVLIAPLAETGEFLAGFGELEGRNVETVADLIIDDLKVRGLLVAKEQYPHVYPHCWRCKTELVFRLVDGWYIRMDWRNRIQNVVPTVRWIPADGEAREQDWLRNMGDWMISKKRFWGLALPIWQCGSCGWFDVIGGEEELQERAIAGWEDFAGHSPHRPYVDGVHIRCENCGGVAHRISDVGNPWLDAGIVPFSTLSYNTNPEEWARWFPADLVVECFPGQFRNWFYALLAMSTMMKDRAPFKVLLGHALVHDERGEEMHKSKGNAIFFDEAAEVIGAEVMRYLYASQNPVANLHFPDLRHEEDATGHHPDQEVRRKLLTLWNCYSFFMTYASADQWRPGKERLPGAKRPAPDRWILSRVQRLIGEAESAFAQYAVHRFMDRFEQFTEEFSNWYLRRSRRRFWKSEMDEDKRAAYETLYEVLSTLIRLLAPVLPFLAEEMYQCLVRSAEPDAPESVHLCAYPKITTDLLDDALEAHVATVVRIKNLGLNLRNQCKTKIRQPLGKLQVLPRDEQERLILADPEAAREINEECNFKTLELLHDVAGIVTPSVRANLKALGQKLGKRMGEAKALLEAMDPVPLSQAIAEQGYYPLAIGGEEVRIEATDIAIVYDAGEGRVVLEDGGTFVILETVITHELALEGLARDLNRQIQNMRKEADLAVTDRIHISYSASDKIAEAVERFDEYLREETLAETIVRVDSLADGVSGKIGTEAVRLLVTRSR